MGCVWVFRTRVVMVGNSQSEFIVKVHTFIPKNSLEFLGIPTTFRKGKFMCAMIVQIIQEQSLDYNLLLVL